MPHNHITWIEISKNALQHNVRVFKRMIPRRTELMAVVKSNAYGHGLVETAKVLVKGGCDWLGTVNLSEALKLRQAGIRCRILVLSFFDPDRLEEAIRKNITLTVYTFSALQEINKHAKKIRKRASIHLKVDTGTRRLGLTAEEIIMLAQEAKLLPNLTVEGIFSHLADAENPNQRITNRQLQSFDQTLQELERHDIRLPIRHIACSAATLLNPRSHYDLVRVGISLYGLWSIEPDGRKVTKIHKQVQLHPALAWKTRIIQTKHIPRGSGVGYGSTYTTRRPMKLAILPVGYWDGYDRRLSNVGYVVIRGTRCPIRGRVCMNLIMVDISSIPEVRPGETATLIGTDRGASVTADTLAQLCGTINYEIVTRINPLIPRIYVN